MISGNIESLRERLRAIRHDLVRREQQLAAPLADYSIHSKSARNLVHYLGLRHNDLRELQEQLAALGLSSLGRTESHVLAGIDAVLNLLDQLWPGESHARASEKAAIDFREGDKLLRANSDALLGPRPRKRSVRIMVTASSEAATDYELVRQLLASGMDCMRVNCAHDDAQTWAGMIANLRRAREELGRECRIEIDLAGPKLRTGSIDPRVQTVRWRPQRDLTGEVKGPACIWITPLEKPEPPPSKIDGTLSVPAAMLATMGVGGAIRFKDRRSKARTLEISEIRGANRIATAHQTVYLQGAALLPFEYFNLTKFSGEARVGPSTRPFIFLRPNDTLVLTRDAAPGHPAIHDSDDRVVQPATIACTLPHVFGDLHPGEPIWFDDGKIGGVIEKVTTDAVTVRITIARPEGERLGPDKGINLPESKLRLPALTEKDIADLTFVVQHADIVGFSFVRRAADVAALQRELARLGAPDIGIVLKIETRIGFERLPRILLQALKSRRVGVMIARGDLAVECGWERLAEAQEEILWFCEAAHVPVIWATQVLENLAKRGAPSRAEITDAAMSERAECVMLNKGPHLVQAVRVLDDILTRMEAHQSKKSARLRRLHLSDLPLLGETAPADSVRKPEAKEPAMSPA